MILLGIVNVGVGLGLVFFAPTYRGKPGSDPAGTILLLRRLGFVLVGVGALQLLWSLVRRFI
jgi:hypothetical protein